MSVMQQRAELQRRIWQIANDVRGSVLLVSPEYAHGCNNECTRGSFFPVIRTSQIVYRNNIPFLIVQRSFPSHCYLNHFPSLT